MNIKERAEDVFVKIYCVVIYYFAVLFVTGYIGTYTLGLLMNMDSDDGFDPSMIFLMLVGAFVIAGFGWPMLLIAAGIYTILFPFMARLSLRFFGPALLIVILVALLQAKFLSRFFGGTSDILGIAILTATIAVPTHLLTLLFAFAYNRQYPLGALLHSRSDEAGTETS